MSTSLQRKAFAAAGILGLALSVAVPLAASAQATTSTSTVKVTIYKFLDGAMANASSTNSASFPMSSNWTASNIGSGSGTFSLGPTGFNSPNPYTAVTSNMTVGANYAVSETMNANTAATCGATTTPPHFRLVGYTWGTTTAAAQAMTPTTTAPSFTNMQGDMSVIVWNAKCNPATTTPTTTPPSATSTVKVTITKFIDGMMATANNAGNMSFPMFATWNSTSTGSGSGSFTLGPTGHNSPNAYTAVTANMTTGARYSTSETLGGNTAASCGATSTPPHFRLVGYSWGTSQAAAQAMTPTTTAPNFTNLTNDMNVIVWNAKCHPATTTPTTTPPTATSTGKLVVHKFSVGGSGTFSFHANHGVGAFTITTTHGHGTATLENLKPGRYHVVEPTVPGEWRRFINTCRHVMVRENFAAHCFIVNRMPVNQWDTWTSPSASQWDHVNDLDNDN